jgi:diadenylate cyclase
MSLIAEITHVWKPIIEILILWLAIYRALLFFEGTRAVHVLRGILILLVLFFLFRELRLDVLDWLLAKIFGLSVIAILIIFHPEIRQGLARLGQRHLFSVTLGDEELDRMLNNIIDAVDALGRNKIGALIAIEKNDSLNVYIESGVIVDARVSDDLIETIFTPNSLLHDGGLIIQRGRIMAAGCLFPLNQKHDLSRLFGTRHRAALGLSEETDALVIIISEERQDVSLVYRGRFYKDLSRQDLLTKIKDTLKLKK